MEDSIHSLGDQATCRICRSEATPEEPLFHPCRCSGSIRNVHQECLVEWLSHSQKKHCELCKTPFRFTKLYDAHMPENLPWRVFVKRAVWDLWSTIFAIIRASLVAFVWLIVLPWIIRWAWRWMFWFADAGWAREEYFRRMSPDRVGNDHMSNFTSFRDELLHSARTTSWTSEFFRQVDQLRFDENTTNLRLVYGIVGSVLSTIGIENLANTTRFEPDAPWKQEDSSIFASVSYMSSLTPYASLNRVILDIFEGQLITCTVILSFILIFLIREWVVQQQPLINQDQQVQQVQPPREPDVPAVHQIDDRYGEIAARIADLKADIDADLDKLDSLQDRVQAQRQGIEDARRPGMPRRDLSSRAARIRRELDDGHRAVVKQQSPTIDPRPITNAGADARVFIQWRRNVEPVMVKPLADDDPALLTNDQLTSKLQGSAADEAEPAVEGTHPDELLDAIERDDALAANATLIEDALPLVEQYDEEADLHTPFERDDELPVIDNARLPLKRSVFDKLADWFWEGIEANDTADEQVIVIDEQRLGLAGNEAPFVPVNHNHHHHHDHDHDHNAIDPEVAAAAQQAGLDPELGDAAEEMEGLLELVGIRGPLIGMVQTSLFCLLLVVSTVLAAVVLPYFCGKLFLSFLGSPVYFLVVLPLKVMSFLADFIVDATLLSGGWILSISAVATEAILAALSTFWPRFAPLNSYVAKVSDAALTEASASGHRLQAMFSSADPYSLNESMLSASAHAHTALKDMTAEATAIIRFVSTLVHEAAHLASTRDLSAVRTVLSMSMEFLSDAPRQLQEVATMASSTFQQIFAGFKEGNIALPTYSRSGQLDPTLVYWDSADRSVAVVAGYLAFAAVAAIYVASDISFTSSNTGRQIEKATRDSLKQAGGVLKVILIISIEMLVFPFYCGLLLDFAFLPLFQNSTLATRLALAVSKPYLFGFVHWFLGTYYMFHFALFVGMCRKILRKGVLWFIRDPDDPDFHPVRDVLERNVTKQLRKIAFSAIVYGALVILCVGGVIWSIGKLFKGIFPIVWLDTEPLLEFPLDLFLYTFVAPLLIILVRPSDLLQAAYAWWLRRCARALRLSHFLFGQRMQDEEGFYVFPSWKSMAFVPLLQLEDGSIKTGNPSDAESEAIQFTRDGSYVLTPSHDQYRHPKPGEVFLSKTADDDVEIVDQDGRRHPHWSKVYLPPHFKIRVMLFMVSLWIFSAFAGLCVTLLPLSFGRKILAYLLPDALLGDIYAYSIGIVILGSLLYLAVKSRAALQASYADDAAQRLKSWAVSMGPQVSRFARCAYVYGYTFVIQPLLITALIELYVFIPMHTFLGLKAQGGEEAAATAALLSAGESFNVNTWLNDVAAKDYTIVRHDVHLAQDLALAILLINVFLRFIIARPNTRGAEAIRQATKDGLLNPDTWIVTRYFTLPTLIMSLFFLITPLVGSYITIAVLRWANIPMSPTFQVLVHRFGYASFEALLILANEMFSWSAATLRWRARIRDEVYLVGERLHNFGEKRPPAGSKSIMRRKRGTA